MKRGILYLFLFTYSTVMFKPVLPYITDFIAHILFFKDHLQTVHAHQGKFHAHTAVAEGAKNDQSGKTTDNFKKDNFGSDHIIISTAKRPVQNSSNKYTYSLSSYLITREIPYDYPPPRV